MASQAELAVDVVQFALDIVGIADPSGAADLASGLISLGRGKWLDMAISGASMLPYVGDLAKTAKLPRYAKSIADAVKLGAKDHKFASQLKPALGRLKSALDKVPLDRLPASSRTQILRIKTDIETFLKRRMYNPHPKHELAGVRGVKGTRLDITSDQAYELLNDATRCFEVPGARQFVAVKDRKIYVFQSDGVGGFHGYRSTGNEITTKYPAIASRVAAMFDVDFKRLSRME